jgi:hypothetical protein
MDHAMARTGGRLMAGPREFETFYAASYRRLVVQLLGVTGNLHDAEDAVQEAFARAAVRWRRVSEYEAPEAWVRRVAFNLALPPAPPATAPPATVPERTVQEPTTTRPPTTTVPPTTAAPATAAPVRGLRILEPRPGTVVRPGQLVRMRAVGCPPGGQVRFEEGTAITAGPDGSFSTEFEIPPGPAGDLFLDATCGGVTREVKLRRQP